VEADRVMLSTTHRLQDGLRVRLRFPYSTDRAAVAALYARVGLLVDEIELRRLLRFDLRRRRVICAVAWVDGAEQVLGIASTTHDGDPTPEVLVADEERAPGVGRLLRAALAEQASQHVA
jgi:hypothetical protein